MAELRTKGPDLWAALYPLCLVMLTMALIVGIVFITEDPVTAVGTVIAGFGLALALH